MHGQVSGEIRDQSDPKLKEFKGKSNIGVELLIIDSLKIPDKHALFNCTICLFHTIYMHSSCFSAGKNDLQLAPGIKIIGSWHKCKNAPPPPPPPPPPPIDL